MQQNRLRDSCWNRYPSNEGLGTSWISSHWRYLSLQIISTTLWEPEKRWIITCPERREKKEMKGWAAPNNRLWRVAFAPKPSTRLLAVVNPVHAESRPYHRQKYVHSVLVFRTWQKVLTQCVEIVYLMHFWGQAHCFNIMSEESR